MDSQKGANWAQIIGTFIAAVLLGYAVWDHWPTANQSVGVGWGSSMRGYVPPAIIALILLASSALQLILWRRHQLTRTDYTQPTLEILSPFDNEEVGLYEIARGRVFPPNSNLQVLVFAGDRKWYPQPHVDVKGSTWSVKCQFGNLETPSGGAYKIVAVLGSELREGMWYSDLPTATPQSNIITVYRPDITIEQELDEAKRGWREWERKYHKVNNEKIPVETERDNLKNQVAQLKQEIVSIKESHQFELTGERIEKNTLKEDLENVKRELKNAYLRVHEETNQRNNWMTSYYEKENRLTDLKWLTKFAEDQAVQLSDHIRVEVATYPHCGEMQLSGKDLCVLLGLSIKNESVFEISIDEKKITGQFSLNNVAFREKADQLIDTFRAPLHNLKPQQKEMIVIEQPLREFEAEKIKRCLEDPDAKFWIGGVRVPISINNPGFEVKGEPCLLWGSGEVPLKNFKRNTDNA